MNGYKINCKTVVHVKPSVILKYELSLTSVVLSLPFQPFQEASLLAREQFKMDFQKYQAQLTPLQVQQQALEKRERMAKRKSIRRKRVKKKKRIQEKFALLNFCNL